VRLSKNGAPWGNKWQGSAAPVEQIQALYASGLSARQVAREIGYSPSHVSRLCQAIARSKQDAAILRQPPKSKHWRSARAAARKIVERARGCKLDPSVDVHHKDGDYTNNTLDNLEVIPRDEHARLHGRRRYGAA